MDISAYSNYIGQALVMRVAMEALTVVMAVLFCLTLTAFVIYLTGVFLLCRVEDRPSEQAGRRRVVAIPKASQSSKLRHIQHDI